MSLLKYLPIRMFSLRDPNNIKPADTTPIQPDNDQEEQERESRNKPCGSGGRKHFLHGHGPAKGFNKIGEKKGLGKAYWKEQSKEPSIEHLDAETKEDWIAAKKEAWEEKFEDSNKSIKKTPINPQDSDLDPASLVLAKAKTENEPRSEAKKIKPFIKTLSTNPEDSEDTTPIQAANDQREQESQNRDKPCGSGGRKDLLHGHGPAKGFNKIGGKKDPGKGYWKEQSKEPFIERLDAETKEDWIAAKKEAWEAKFNDPSKPIKKNPINPKDSDLEPASLELAKTNVEATAKAERKKSINKDMIGSAKNDEITGSLRPDKIHGRSGHDTLLGLRGADLIKGGKGDDLIDGGRGRDRLLGGKGADVFRMSPGRDVIADFNIEQGDIIEIKAVQVDSFKQVQRGLLIKINDFGSTTLLGIEMGDFEASNSLNLG